MKTFLVLLMINCSIVCIAQNDTETPDVKKAPKTFAEARIFLEAFTIPGQVQIFINAYDKYAKIKTDAELAQFYLVDVDSMKNAINAGMLVSHPDVVYSGDSGPADDWAWINKFFPYLMTSCPCSECSSEAFIHISEFQKKAKTTEGETDDLFFDALYAYFGSVENSQSLAFAGNINNWFTMDDCDFCSYNNLGNGNYTNMIKKTIAVEKKTKLFDPVLENLVSLIMSAEYSKHFGQTKAKVLAEIEEILKLKDQTKFDLSGLNNLKKKLISGSKDIQFNCANAKCTYDY